MYSQQKMVFLEHGFKDVWMPPLFFCSSQVLIIFMNSRGRDQVSDHCPCYPWPSETKGIQALPVISLSITLHTSVGSGNTFSLSQDLTFSYLSLWVFLLAGRRLHRHNSFASDCHSYQFLWICPKWIWASGSIYLLNRIGFIQIHGTKIVIHWLQAAICKCKWLKD